VHRKLEVKSGSLKQLFIVVLGMMISLTGGHYWLVKKAHDHRMLVPVLTVYADMIRVVHRLTGRTPAVNFEQIRLTGKCRFCDLRGLELDQKKLAGADLRDADLSGSSFRGSDLAGIQLQRSRIDSVDFSAAIMSQANLFGAEVYGSVFHEVDLAGSDLRFSRWIGVDLTEADLQHVALYKTEWRRVLALSTDFSGASGFSSTKGLIECKTILPDSSVTPCDLRAKDLREFDLSRRNLVGADFRGAKLKYASLNGANLIGANLSGLDLVDLGLDAEGTYLSAANLSRAVLKGVNFDFANMDHVDLSSADLRGSSFVGANLSGANLSRANIAGADLSQAFLYGAKLTSLELSTVNLVGARLHGVDMSGSNMTGAIFGALKVGHKNQMEVAGELHITNIDSISGVTSFFELDENLFVTTKVGRVCLLKRDHCQTVFDLSHTPNFQSGSDETGLLSIAANAGLIYLSFTEKGDNEFKLYLVVNEYTDTFKKLRTVIRLGAKDDIHSSGALDFDHAGNLYLSVGDGGPQGDPYNLAQDLDSLRGKILRFDLDSPDTTPEIVAYGLRNPWKIDIDDKGRMFVADCGYNQREAVYLLPSLDPSAPYNLGWPAFEGSLRFKESLLQFEQLLAPIYEYAHYGSVGVCIIGGIFHDVSGAYVFGDILGHLRFLKEASDGSWYEVYHQHIGVSPWSFGYSHRRKKVLIGGTRTREFSVEPGLNWLLPRITLCNTRLPSGLLDHSHCE
jgi:uncharacterized protein YjbI with pentapeptide repeats